MKALVVGAILGLLLGLTLVTIDGWKILPDNTANGVHEVVYGGMEDREKGEQRISYKENISSESIQILFKLGLLVLGLGLGIGIGSFFDEGGNYENNNS